MNSRKSGGELLIIDEIHKCQHFERDLKLIFDQLFQSQGHFHGFIGNRH
jgi:hypothetical protein